MPGSAWLRTRAVIFRLYLGNPEHNFSREYGASRSRGVPRPTMEVFGRLTRQNESRREQILLWKEHYLSIFGNPISRESASIPFWPLAEYDS